MKKFIAFILALAVICPLGGNMEFSDTLSICAAEASNESDFGFSNGAITGYTGTDTDIVIPSSINGEAVTSIADWTFANCTSITSITIPEGVESIGYYAFMNCTSLETVNLPASVNQIVYDAFFGCTSLAEINVSEGNEYYCSEDGILFNYDKTCLVCCPAGKAVGAFTIPDTVNEIEDCAFAYCTQLTDITIPENINSIGNSVFSSCTSLTSIYIHENITTLDSSAFENCSSLTEINVSEANQYYCSEDGVLFNTDKSALLCYPAGKPDDSYAVPSGVVSIESSAFCGSPLVDITIPETVSYIGLHAFRNTPFLENLKNSSEDGLIVTGNILYEYYEKENQTKIIIPDNVVCIGEFAFSSCYYLESITIPQGVVSVGKYAFMGCDALKEVIIADSLETIEFGAFDDCTALADIYYAGSEEQWKNISVERYNEPLDSAAVHYLSSGPDIPDTTPGDINGNGKIDATDFISLKNFILNPSDSETLNADMNSDGKVNALDLILMKKSILGLN